MNGNQALGYARIRKSAGESDFTRAARQQQVVVALKDKVVRGGFLEDPLGLLKAVGETVKTNIPPSVVRTLAPLAKDISSKDIFRTVVGHPLVRSGRSTTAARSSCPTSPRSRPSAPGCSGRSGRGRPIDFVTKAPTSVAKGPAQAKPKCYAAPKPKPKPKPTPKPTPEADEEADADARADPDARADHRADDRSLTPGRAGAPGSTAPPLLPLRGPCSRSRETGVPVP